MDLPDEIKRELLSYEKRWRNLHVKWTNFYKLHITVSFLGEVDRSGLEAILSAAKKTSSEIKSFDACLDRIVLGPDPVQAKMFWATVLIDANLIKLKRVMEQNLKFYGFELEKAEFKPHVTFARARGNQLKGKQTNIVLRNMKFKVEGIEVMESQLRPNIEKHKLVESFKLAS